MSISNQNVLAAEAQFRAAQAAVRVVDAARFPAVSLAPTVTQTGAGGPSSINRCMSSRSM